MVPWSLLAARGFLSICQGPCAGGVRLCCQAPGEVVPALLTPCSRAQCCFFAELLLMLNTTCCCCSRAIGFVSPRTQDCHTGARKVWGAAATQRQLVVSWLPPSFCQFVLIQLFSPDVQSACDVWWCCVLCLRAIRVLRVRAALPRCRMHLHSASPSIPASPFVWLTTCLQ